MRDVLKDLRLLPDVEAEISGRPHDDHVRSESHEDELYLATWSLDCVDSDLLII
jgi:hypothetical protein